MDRSGRIYVGTAGWSLPRAAAPRFETTGTHLQRYATQFNCVEINSSFYRPHLPKTYARWRESTPPGFRIALKAPRAITHEARLHDTKAMVVEFLEQTSTLEEKRGPILVQLPPSLEFDRIVAVEFFDMWRMLHDGPLVCEPRHPSWFSAAANDMLCAYRIARVAADPAVVPCAIVPGGCARLAYFRLHGSPRMYWSRYDADNLAALAGTIQGISATSEVWCVFDNTAAGAALDNAWDLRDLLSAESGAWSHG